MAEYYIEIVEYGTGEVIKRMGPKPERFADRIERGANINLNHDKYYTRQVEAEKEEGEE
jgi:hypothetical protein